MRALRVRVGNWEMSLGTLALGLTEQQQLFAILTVALLQGLVFVAIVPPWQHYDEPTHFEYAWLMARLGRQPHPGDENAAMRREVQASMATRGLFDPHPTLIQDDASRIWIGYSELGHPPSYYALAAIPIALLSHLDVTSQLYLARLVSVALLVSTVAIAWAIVRELTPPNNPLRTIVPLVVVLLPTFADVMTSVNSDVGAVFVLSLFFWGAVRMIRRGFTWRRLLWVAGATLLGVFTKNTAMYSLILTPVAIMFSFAVRNRWPLWRLSAGLVGIAVAAALALFGWGDAARWYRADTVLTQPSATRIATEAAPDGSFAFVVETDAVTPQRRLLFPLRDADVTALGGKTVTLGGWVWADRAVDLIPFELDVASKGDGAFRRFGQPGALTTQPVFMAQSVTLPPGTRRAQLALVADAAPGTPPLRVYFDGVILVEGTFDAAAAPVFSDNEARHGTWGSRRFTNLVGDASAEQAWLRPRAWLDDRARAIVRHRPSEAILSILDTDRTSSLLIGWAVPLAVDGLVERFAWSQVRLASVVWIWALRAAIVLAIVGCVRWAARHGRRQPASRTATLAFLVLALGVVWGVTILRPLPMLGPVLIAPGTRYAFPAIVPTALVLAGGWMAAWPGRRTTAAVVIVAAMLVLEIASFASIRAFFGTG